MSCQASAEQQEGPRKAHVRTAKWLHDCLATGRSGEWQKIARCEKRLRSRGGRNLAKKNILEAKGGGRKLALQNGKVEGSEVGKNTALFLEAGVKSPLYVALCPDPPAREEREREERRKDERQRGERERERRDEMR